MALARRRVAVALLALLANAGCLPERSGLSSDTSPLWTHRDRGICAVAASPPDGTVLATSNDPARVIALDARTGRQLWSTEAGGGTIICSDGIALTQTFSERPNTPAETVALDAATGAVLWRTPAWQRKPEPRLRAGLAVGLRADGTFETVDARTGTPVSAFNPQRDWPPARGGVKVEADALTDKGRLLLKTTAPSLLVVDLRTRSTSEIPLPAPVRYRAIRTRGERAILWGGVSKPSNPLDEVESWLFACDVESGDVLWSKRSEDRRYLDVALGPAGVLFAYHVPAGDYDNQKLMAYDEATGRELWPTPRPRREAMLVSFGESFGPYVVERASKRSGELTASNVSDGTQVWTTQTNDPDTSLAKVLARDGMVFMQAASLTPDLGRPAYVSESRVAAFDLATGQLVWRYVDEPFATVTPLAGVVVVAAPDRLVALPLRKAERSWFGF
jgi:outer membrane protein assembly factor BamB